MRRALLLLPLLLQPVVTLAQPTAAPQPPPRQFGPDPAKVYAVPLDGAVIEGADDAKVTMVVVSEYLCPWCEKMRPTLAELRKKYGKDLRIAHFQYTVHANATASALASCAAAKQSRWVEMDALLWDKGFAKRNFDTDTVPVPKGSGTESCWKLRSCAVVNGFAQELKLDMKRFHNDMLGCEQQLQTTRALFGKLGVTGIPAFFINGRYMGGNAPASTFEPLIDEVGKLADEEIKRGTKKSDYYQKFVVDKGDTGAP